MWDQLRDWQRIENLPGTTMTPQEEIVLKYLKGDLEQCRKHANSLLLGRCMDETHGDTACFVFVQRESTTFIESNAYLYECNGYHRFMRFMIVLAVWW